MDKQDTHSSEQGDELCKQINTWIKETYDDELNKDWRKRITTNRKYNSGKDLQGDGEVGLVRANLIYSTIQSLLPRIYAKNPEIAISPTETVGEERPDWIKPFCTTLTIVLNRYFEDAELKKRGKASARSAMVIGLSWLKVSYQRDIREDVEIFNRISDSQDNLQRIEHLISKIEDDDESYEELEAQKLELHQQLRGLQEKAEVVVAEGLAIDRLKPEDVLIDLDIDDPDAYKQADRMAHRVWYTRDKYMQSFDKEPGPKATKYTRSGDDKTEATEDKKALDRFAVWEVWDKVSQTVYTVCENDDNWAREPFTPELIGERFYSIFMLHFNPVDGVFLSMSDVELLQEVADEYNATRTQLAEHRKLNKPKYVADAATEVETLRRYEDSVLGEIILVDANGKPLNEVIQPAKNIPINPVLYDTSPIRADFEFLSGAGDAGRGSVQNAKTATEATILEETLASRTSERQDTIEDLIKEIAIYTSQMLLLELKEPQVKRIAGSEAVWPQLSKDVIFDNIQIEVRAGTSGKPNRIQEQKTWMEFMPMLRENVVQISELRTQGREEEADTMVAITKETFRRFDERIDIEEFIPTKDTDDPEVALAQAMQKIKQMEQMLMQAQEQMKQLQQQAQQEIEKAKTANSKDVGNKLFELEKMKLTQYDTFNEMIAGLQQNYQAGVNDVMKILADIQTKATDKSEVPPVINLSIDAKSGEVTKTIEVVSERPGGGIGKLTVTPHEEEVAV